jgi:type II secretory pathway component PulF
MLLSSQLPLSSLIEFCRVVRHNLGAGLTLLHVFRQQSLRGPAPVRPVAERIRQELEEGESLEAALKQERAHFPPMFISLAIVGEQTGCLPEVFAELEKFFLLQQRLRRQFFTQIAWPAIQFFIAPFVIAGMIFFLGILASDQGKSMAPLGQSYVGVLGAIRFLVHFFGGLGLLVALYFVVTRTLKQQAFVHELLLRLPVVGPCVQAIALMRFCMALRLTMDTGMPITRSLDLSLRATGNEAYAARSALVQDALREGEDLALALSRAGIFPYDFVNILANAEEGGRVPEVMRHQAEYYEEESRRRMTMLTMAASGVIWLCVAGFLIFMIFRIASRVFMHYDPANYGL